MLAAGGPLAADPSQRPEQPDMPNGVRELRPPHGLEMGEQVEPARVVGAVADTDNGTTQVLPGTAERACSLALPVHLPSFTLRHGVRPIFAKRIGGLRV